MKKGILVTSFGTSYPETREKTIGAIENHIKEKFSDFEVRRAFTSSMVRKKIEKNEGIKIDDVDEALKKMKEDGFEEIYISSLHIIPGHEYKKVTHGAYRNKEGLNKIECARPLLYSKEHYDEVVSFIEEIANDLDKDEALVLMGHGSDHAANSAYVMMQYLMDRNPNTIHSYMGTVEGYPEIEDVLKEMKSYGYKKVKLMPFMIVAGDHAINDMASDEEDSWKTIFEKEGYEVETILKGLGEFETIRKIFAERLKETIEK
ncbi:sirohydrochlorin cobaltochelatase [Acetoanaerobium pronyense]|uniref:Sirohydrochlorin cobaltochelatase n=1 Tax=Acetoanaerobium pronyense TaxID=1482736 RepID=A0ABS4KKH2_9FIRM|nr:sirohydrochlorin cobaltochelatase [Acetoanaerobium pronyense]MBP2028285.1 sirohydrochlorin cobaltochelatase [Acetoanaerobium pronyense]